MAKINDYKLNAGKSGQAALIAVMFLVFISLSVVSGISYMALREAKISRINMDATKSYLAAEAGVEDIVYRAMRGVPLPPTNPDILYVDDIPVSRDVNLDLGLGQVTVISEANVNGHIRKIKAVASASVGTSFYYGVHVGLGGVTMASNSKIIGNIFANGTIVGSSNAEIIGDAISAGPGGLIDTLEIIKSDPFSTDGNARAHTINKTTIENGAYYQSISQSTAGSYYPGSDDQQQQNFPLSDAQIQA